MEDGNNRNRLSKLLRVRTTKSGGELVPLSDYVERMKEDQDGIYYVCGSSMEEVQRSPYLERLKEHDLEVVLFTEPMDEYMMQVRTSPGSVRMCRQHAAICTLSLCLAVWEVALMWWNVWGPHAFGSLSCRVCHCVTTVGFVSVHA